jgi:hypothetical protein
MVFFSCLGHKIFSKIARNEPWPASRLDITLAAVVQNILKKVKKRLVSPFKPR